MEMRTIAIAAVVAVALSPAAAKAERLTVPLSEPGKAAQVEVSLVMGSIKVTGAAIREVVIDARSRDEEPDRSRPERSGMRRIPNTAVGLMAEEEGNKVSIGADSHARAVDLEIQVPAGSRLSVSTVNGGEIEIENIDGEIEASNTNGGIRIRNVKGPVSATTVNGSVLVVFRGSMAQSPMAFSTLNGDIDVSFPASLKADVTMRSDNGEIFSDFDIVLGSKPARVEEEKGKGRYRVVMAREMTGKIAGGGPEILLKTFNGDILLRRAQN
jgi:DUF4097 and DUF4098 domain-containing protein YvlB